MTRTKALEVYGISFDDFNDLIQHNDIDTVKSIVKSKFAELVKNVHPDTANNKHDASVSDIKNARDVLITFAEYKYKHINNQSDEYHEDGVCPYCLGEGYIKVVKGFKIVSKMCECTRIKRKNSR